MTGSTEFTGAIGDTAAQLYLDMILTHGLAMIAHDRGDRPVLVSPAWAELLGYPLERLATVPCIDLVHPDDRDHVAHLTKRLRSGEARTTSSVIRMVRADNADVWVRLQMSRFVSEPDDLLMCVAQDITEDYWVDRDAVRSRWATD